MKTTIGRGAATTLRELLDVLEGLRPPGRTPDDAVCVTINSDSIRLKLVEETLTDGSSVYNIELSEASK